MENSALSELLTMKDLMKRYRISQDKAYELIHNKDFPSFKIKGRYYVRADLLLKWEDNLIVLKRKSA